MALQTFTAGQVLTAAQVNALQTNDFNQTVSTKVANYTLVVGDRGTRVVGNGTSITFTVDNNIFTAGDTIKLHNINSTVLTIAAGAGVTINAAAGLTMLQWQEATLFATSASSFILFESTAATTTQGLTLISTQSFSAVASFSLPGNTFSATYDNYKIIVNLDTSSSAVGCTFRMRAAGTDNTSANYAWNLYGGTQAPAGTFGSSGGALATSFSGNAISGTYSSTSVIEVIRPFATDNTNILINGGYFDSIGNYAGQTIFGSTSVTTSYDSLTMIPASGTFTGTYSVYGYNK